MGGADWDISSTMFYPSGKIEYTEYLYGGNKVGSEEWQVSTENFEQLAEALIEKSFFSLPSEFECGPTDIKRYSLFVYTKDMVYSCEYNAFLGNKDKVENTYAYSVLSECAELFLEYTERIP